LNVLPTLPVPEPPFPVLPAPPLPEPPLPEPPPPVPAPPPLDESSPQPIQATHSAAHKPYVISPSRIGPPAISRKPSETPSEYTPDPGCVGACSFFSMWRIAEPAHASS